VWRYAEVVTTLDHPIDAVFPYLADPLRWHRFAPACVFRHRIDDGAVRIGSRWMATDRIGPFRFHFVDQLAELEPNHRVVWLSSWPWNARVEYRCTANEQGTHIRATYAGDVSGSLRLVVGWLPAWATNRILAQDFRRLDRLLRRERHERRRWERGRPRTWDEPVSGEGGMTGVQPKRPAIG
jgi:uncharacterized protein YndB with AHSA1/START domain